MTTYTNGSAEQSEMQKPSIIQKVTAHLSYQDVPIDIDLSGVAIEKIEQIINNALKRPGWKAYKPPVGGGFGPRKPQIPPFYDGDGNECCPHHRVILKQGQYSKMCPQRLPVGDEHVNERGYCKYTWKDGK